MRFALLTAALALAVSPLALAADKPIAVVDGKAIPAVYGELVKQEMTAKGQGDVPNLDDHVRESLVNLRILANAAESKGLDKTPKSAAILELRRMDQLAKLYLEDYIKSHPVADKDINDAYDKMKNGPGFAEFKARHILVKTEAEAKKVMTELNKGGNFAALAKKYSKDTGSAEKGGDLGWANPASYVPEFSQALVALKPGDRTKEPVKTQYGYHIIQLDNVRKGEVPKLADIRQDLTRQLAQLRIRDAIADLRAKAKVE